MFHVATISSVLSYTDLHGFQNRQAMCHINTYSVCQYPVGMYEQSTEQH